MSKSSETYFLEETLTLFLNNTYRLIGAPEVSLGELGQVDYMAIDFSHRKPILSCYELKISKSDFMSDAKKTWAGHYNYYVIPTRLYGQIRGRIESNIGVLTISPKGYVEEKKKPKKIKPSVSFNYCLTRLLLALNREYVKSTRDQLLSRTNEYKLLDATGKQLNIGDYITTTVLDDPGPLQITSVLTENHQHMIVQLLRVYSYTTRKEYSLETKHTHKTNYSKTNHDNQQDIIAPL